MLLRFFKVKNVKLIHFKSHTSFKKINFDDLNLKYSVKRLHRLILKSYVGPFVLTFFITLFIFLLQFIWKYVDDLVGKGLDFSTIFELIFYFSITFIPMSLPMAILLSSIMLFGNMGENNELLAFKSAGVPLMKIMSSLIILMIVISASAFIFSNNVLPYSALKARALLRDIQKTRPELTLKTGIFTNSLKGYSIKISGKNKKTKMLYDLMIYDHSNRRGNTIINLADSGKMYLSEQKTHMILELYHGSRFEDIKEQNQNSKKHPFERHYFDKEILMFPMDGFGLKRNDEDIWKDHHQMMNLEQLDFTIDSISKKLLKKEADIPKTLNINSYFRKEIKEDSLMYLSVNETPVNVDSLFSTLPQKKQVSAADIAINFARSARNYIESIDNDITIRSDWLDLYRVEWHRKFTLSIACLILFFIGAPLGAIIRKGGFGMPVVISILFFIAYHIISVSGEKTIKSGNLEPVIGMWISSAILLPIGLFLTYKASRDSVILNTASYREIFKKVKKLVRKKGTRFKSSISNSNQS